MRVEDGFGVVRTADCPGSGELDQFAGDPSGLFELFGGKFLVYDSNAFSGLFTKLARVF